MLVLHKYAYVYAKHVHLIDEKKCADTEHRFGRITGKYVLYRGVDFEAENGIHYRNVEEYLKQL
mgnify:CR=1 FL=1